MKIRIELSEDEIIEKSKPIMLILDQAFVSPAMKSSVSDRFSTWFALLGMSEFLRQHLNQNEETEKILMYFEDKARAHGEAYRQAKKGET